MPKLGKDIKKTLVSAQKNQKFVLGKNYFSTNLDKKYETNKTIKAQ